MSVDQNDFFRQATLRLCSSLDIEVAMCRCLRYLETAIPVDSMYLVFYNRGLGTIRTIAMATAGEGRKLDRMIPMPIEARAVLEDNGWPELAIVNRTEENPVSRAWVHIWKIPESSMCYMRLAIEDHGVGSLILCSEGCDRYTDEHVRLLSLLKEPFAIAATNARRHSRVNRLKDLLADDNRYLHGELLHLSGEEIIGADFGLKEVMDLVRHVAPTDSSVLLLGETGVGKEIIANAIHNMSTRRKGPFIKVNSGAIPETLLDSELFGHEKGAFTGAVSQKRGRFERANSGSIFLDEIGELPPQAQVRMLRVLQDKEIERVGGANPVEVDIRVIAATHRNLQEMVRDGRFREDLFFRLNVFPVKIPPLRERWEDIPALVNHFINRKSKELKLHTPPPLAPGAIDRLMAYNWPGNVRELENVVERSLILSRSQPLTFSTLNQLEQSDVSESKKMAYGEVLTLDKISARHIRKVLEMTGGKVHGSGGAAELLGINSSTLRARMQKLGIPYGSKLKREPSF